MIAQEIVKLGKDAADARAIVDADRVKLQARVKEAESGEGAALKIDLSGLEYDEGSGGDLVQLPGE